MKRFWYLILILLLLCACSSETKITEESGRIKILKGGYDLTAAGAGIVDASYMIVGWTRTIGLPGYQDASVACIPLTIADSLCNEYGDFMRCDNPGAREAKQEVVMVDIILSSPVQKSVLMKARSSQKNNLNPVIHLSGRELRIDEASYHGISVSMDNQPATTVLADTVELVQENYSF